MSTAIDEAFRHCEQLTRDADKDRFLATLFAPADRRGALFALYAFDIEIARVRDLAREPLPGELRLQWWRDVLAGERRGEAMASPVAAALCETLSRFALPAESLLEFIEAHSFDLYDDPMPSLEHLEGYARQTASRIMALAAQVLGAAPADVAAPAGIARALTHLMRNFARHASRRQLYVPADLLARHGARVEDVFAGRATPEINAALKELRVHARGQFDLFVQGAALLPRAGLPAVLPAVPVPLYLERMERPDYDPFRTIVDVPQWRRQWALWRGARRMARKARA